MKVSLEAIGLTSLFGLPWVLKFLWGPQIDQFGTKRRWMLSMQFLLVIMVITVAFLSPIPGGIKIIAVLFFIGSFIAATHDMAIDGYYMEALDKQGQAKFVGYRVMAYRIAMMTGTGIIVTIGTTTNWFVGYLSAGGMLALLFIYHLSFLPDIEQQKIPIWNLLKSLIRLKPFMTLVVLVAAFLFLRWIFSLGWYQPDQIPILKKIRFSGWVAIGLIIALIILALFKDRIKLVLLRDSDSFYSKALWRTWIVKRLVWPYRSSFLCVLGNLCLHLWHLPLS